MRKELETDISKKYWAFISYSSRDAKWGKWFHKRLENYTIPKEFQDIEFPDGTKLGKHIRPVFRDRDELASSSELGEVISEALEQSRFLIVLCSPNSAKSVWVNKEIEDFRAMHGDGNVLALILDGEPNATTNLNLDDSVECFPPALQLPLEPLAGDLRPEADGKERGFLKILAGIADIGFDDLYRRHERAQRKRRLVGATLAFIAIALLAGLTIFALNQKSVAEEQAEKALRSAERSKEVLDILTDSFEVGGFNKGGNATNPNMLASEVLGRARERLYVSTLDEPGKAQLLVSVWRSYVSIGDYESSLEIAKEEANLKYKQTSFADKINQIQRLALSHQLTGNLSKSEQLTEHMLSEIESHDGLSVEEESELLLGLANILRGSDNSQAVKILERALASAQVESLEFSNLIWFEIYIELGLAHDASEKSLEYLNKAKRLARHHEVDDTVWLEVESKIGICHHKLGRNAEAIKILDEVSREADIKLGKHLGAFKIKLLLSQFLAENEEFTKAFAKVRELIQDVESTLPEDHMDVIFTKSKIADIHSMAFQFERSIEIREQLVPVLLRKRGADSQSCMAEKMALAADYFEFGQYKKCMKLYENIGEVDPNDFDKTIVFEFLLAAASSAIVLGEEEQCVLIGKAISDATESISKSEDGAPDLLDINMRLALSTVLFETGELARCKTTIDQMIATVRETFQLELDRCLDLKGSVELELGEFAESLESLREAQQIRTKNGLQGSLDFLQTDASIVECLLELDQLDPARELLFDVTKKAVAMNDLSDVGVRAFIGSLSQIHLDLGEFDKSVALMEPLFTWDRKQLGPLDSGFLERRYIYAKGLSETGRFPEAIPIFDDLVRLFKQVHGGNGLKTLFLTCESANAYAKATRFVEAKNLFESAAPNLRKTIGLGDPAVWLASGRQASVYMVLEEYAKAENLFREACEFQRSKNKSNELAIALDNLIEALLAQENYTECEDSINELMQVIDGAYGTDDEVYLRLAQKRAKCRVETGQYTKAIDDLEHLRKHEGESVSISSNRHLWESAYAGAKKVGKLMSMIEEDLAVIKSDATTQPAILANILYGKAVLLASAGGYVQAEELLRDALENQVSIAPKYWKRYDTESFLGEMLLYQKKFEIAGGMLRNGHEGLIKYQNGIADEAFRISRIKMSLRRLIKHAEQTKNEELLKNFSEQLKQLQQ